MKRNTSRRNTVVSTIAALSIVSIVVGAQHHVSNSTSDMSDGNSSQGERQLLPRRKPPIVDHTKRMHALPPIIPKSTTDNSSNLRQNDEQLNSYNLQSPFYPSATSSTCLNDNAYPSYYLYDIKSYFFKSPRECCERNFGYSVGKKGGGTLRNGGIEECLAQIEEYNAIETRIEPLKSQMNMRYGSSSSGGNTGGGGGSSQSKKKSPSKTKKQKTIQKKQPASQKKPSSRNSDGYFVYSGLPGSKNGQIPPPPMTKPMPKLVLPPLTMSGSKNGQTMMPPPMNMKPMPPLASWYGSGKADKLPMMMPPPMHKKPLPMMPDWNGSAKSDKVSMMMPPPMKWTGSVLPKKPLPPMPEWAGSAKSEKYDTMPPKRPPPFYEMPPKRPPPPSLWDGSSSSGKPMKDTTMSMPPPYWKHPPPPPPGWNHPPPPGWNRSKSSKAKSVKSAKAKSVKSSKSKSAKGGSVWWNGGSWAGWEDDYTESPTYMPTTSEDEEAWQGSWQGSWWGSGGYWGSASKPGWWGSGGGGWSDGWGGDPKDPTPSKAPTNPRPTTPKPSNFFPTETYPPTTAFPTYAPSPSMTSNTYRPTYSPTSGGSSIPTFSPTAGSSADPTPFSSSIAPLDLCVWGSPKSSGQDATDDILVPLETGSKAIDASAGTKYSVMIDVNGVAYSSGFVEDMDSYHGHLGLRPEDMSSGMNEFTEVTRVFDDAQGGVTDPPVFEKVFAGVESSLGTASIHTIFLDRRGRVWATGSNSKGQLCLNDDVDRLIPELIPFEGSRIVDVAIGGEHTLLLDEFGNVVSLLLQFAH